MGRSDRVIEPSVSAKTSEERPPVVERLRKFIVRPRREQFAILVHRFWRIFPKIPVPFRLPFGAWFMLGNGVLDSALLWGSFENAELRFVERFLAPDMCVLDIGAHHGLYTLLASKRVGSRGKVIAFEPSPRERRLLSRNLRLNSVSNVHIEPFALGNEPSQAELYLVQGAEDGCNSLRPPAVKAPTLMVTVDINSLDRYLKKTGITKVDFVKLDVEGAEREVLLGAQGLLAGSSRSRPVILAEVQDLRTEPWGYPARKIVEILDRAGYDWFQMLDDGSLAPTEINNERYDANLVAIPRDRLADISDRLGQRFLGIAHSE